MNLFTDPLLFSFSHSTWWIIGTLIMLGEVFVGGAFLLWLGISAITVGLLMYFGLPLDWQAQWMIFAVLSVASIVLWKLFFARNQTDEHNTLSRRADGYIGQQFTVAQAIENGVGKVTVQDTLWRALGDDAPVGAMVTVIGVQGASLQVKNNP